MTTAAVYARISLDDLGLEKGVQRQLEDARQLVQQRGWEIADEYVDNSVSAYDGSARISYKRLMQDAEAGCFDRIVVWQTSRLWRNRTERAQGINLLGRLRIGVAAVKGPELDLTTASGRMIADVLGSFDSMESEVKSERQIRSNLQRAQEGKPGNIVPYGWRRVREMDDSGRLTGYHDVINETEAAIVRELARRVLGSESLTSIVRDLNARAVPTPRRKPGGTWNINSMKQVLLRPANVGKRIYLGQVFGDGNWPPILDQDDYDRLVAVLKAPERAQKRDGARHHLLSYGVGECGVCGGKVSGRSEGTHRDKKGPRKMLYRCDKGCASRNMQKVDELVSAVVIARLSRPDAAGIFDGDGQAATAAREKIDAIKARLATAADSFAAGDIDGEQLKRITARLRPDLDAAEAELRRTRRPAVPSEVDGLHGERAAEVWDGLDVTQKLAIIEALNLKVVIHPRTKSGPGFEPETIQFEWQ